MSGKGEEEVEDDDFDLNDVLAEAERRAQEAPALPAEQPSVADPAEWEDVDLGVVTPT